MTQELRQIAEELRLRFGEELKQILFFGSRARGDATSESDYDCLLIFTQVTGSIKSELNHLACDWLLRNGIVFSYVALSEADLERLRYEPFIMNARREGMAA